MHPKGARTVTRREVNATLLADISPEERRLYGSVDAAFTGQNVYLVRAIVMLQIRNRNVAFTGSLQLNIQESPASMLQLQIPAQLR